MKPLHIPPKRLLIHIFLPSQHWNPPKSLFAITSYRKGAYTSSYRYTHRKSIPQPAEINQQKPIAPSFHTQIYIQIIIFLDDIRFIMYLLVFFRFIIFIFVVFKYHVVPLVFQKTTHLFVCFFCVHW